MSKPANPLDVFTTYTYHFELHAAYSWEDLALATSTDQNLSTTSTKMNKTTVINTRRDAHQTIDDVAFSYIGPSANSNGHFIPDGTMHLKVIEPNKMFFIEKIANMMNDFKISTLGSLHWGLKIFFVGRKPDNTIHTLPYPGIGVMIPMTFVDMESSFTFKGGEYIMNFVSLASFAGANTDESKTNSLLAGYCNKNLSITAKSVKEALKELENQLNLNYKRTYDTELKNDKNARPLKYYIHYDTSLPEGTIDLSVGADSFAPNGSHTMQFYQEDTIVTWIFHILRSSKTLNDLVAESLDGIRKEGHPNVNVLSVFPSFIATKSECQIIYNVSMYRGDNTQIKSLKNNTMEFDFLFGSPGANVDVLGFDIHMKSALAWFSNSTRGSVDAATKISGTGMNNPAVSQNVIVSNQKKETSQASNDLRYPIPIKSGDIAYLNASPQVDATGQIKYKEDAIPSAKLMFNTITQMNAAFDPQFTFTIRGHLDLLTAGIIYPQNEVGKLQSIPFGIRAPLWIKVNIKSPNDQKTSFFYTGRYNVISVENHFSQGKFTQNLVVLMMQTTDTGKGI